MKRSSITEKELQKEARTWNLEMRICILPQDYIQLQDRNKATLAKPREAV